MHIDILMDSTNHVILRAQPPLSLTPKRPPKSLAENCRSANHRSKPQMPAPPPKTRSKTALLNGNSPKSPHFSAHSPPRNAHFSATAEHSYYATAESYQQQQQQTPKSAKRAAAGTKEYSNRNMRHSNGGNYSSGKTRTDSQSSFTQINSGWLQILENLRLFEVLTVKFFFYFFAFCSEFTMQSLQFTRISLQNGFPRRRCATPIMPVPSSANHRLPKSCHNHPFVGYSIADLSQSGSFHRK